MDVSYIPLPPRQASDVVVDFVEHSFFLESPEYDQLARITGGW